MNNPILPPATIGDIGGGQLGQLLALAAKPLGYRVIVLDPTPNAPAGQVADEQIIASYDDAAALRVLDQRVDVLTYEFENVDLTTLKDLGGLTPLPQGTELLAITKNRLDEKSFIKNLGLPVTNFAEVKNVIVLDAAVQQVGLPAILKTVEGGYDGHGQWDIPDRDALAELVAHWDDSIEDTLILEHRIAFDFEISVMVTTDGNDDIRIWPMTQNEQHSHILRTSIAQTNPNQKQLQKVQDIAKTIATAFGLKGVLGIEMFVQGNDIYINELAPRPHNSGHLTIEGTNISQFEGHIRSIVGLPIPEIQLQAPAMMLNLLGDKLTRARNDLVTHPEWHFHDYSKAEIKPLRKMGHITVVGDTDIQALKEWEMENHGD